MLKRGCHAAAAALQWANDFVMAGFEEDPAMKQPAKRRRLDKAMLVNAKHDFIPNQHKEYVTGAAAAAAAWDGGKPEPPPGFKS